MRVKVTGLKKTIDSLRKFGDESDKHIRTAVYSTAQSFEQNAKNLAPVDIGTLKGNIVSSKVTDTHYQIVSGELYSAYMEFGTGGLVVVPEVFKQIAETWRGAGIKKINIQPQPFMYPSYLKAKVQLPKELNDALNRLTNKHG
jgi:HK97 gp10 family phage protein